MSMLFLGIKVSSVLVGYQESTENQIIFVDFFSSALDVTMLVSVNFKRSFQKAESLIQLNIQNDPSLLNGNPCNWT
ncbi:hypothetical protein Anas_03605 [Armadillidium nasatum]|uniref:Uncharacterized protein n=1 Tax=Armadillidium nasatum TaxID=96803 RepID=A0A5N5SQD8_9CRUS|nr:hypothetical protein Anas_03605 [Armadillidium nasatum]